MRNSSAVREEKATEMSGREKSVGWEGEENDREKGKREQKASRR